MTSSDDRPLESFDLGSFTKGWFIGRFAPTLFDTDAVEVAIKTYAAGEAEARHHHKMATELTAIVSGRVRMNGREFSAGEIVLIRPNVATDFCVLENTVTVVVKLPSVQNDKYPGDA